MGTHHWHDGCTYFTLYLNEVLSVSKAWIRQVLKFSPHVNLSLNPEFLTKINRLWQSQTHASCTVIFLRHTFFVQVLKYLCQQCDWPQYHVGGKKRSGFSEGINKPTYVFAKQSRESTAPTYVKIRPRLPPNGEMIPCRVTRLRAMLVLPSKLGAGA